MATVTVQRRRRRGERGAELIEFALVLPLLLFVSLAIVDFGFTFQRVEVLTNAAREGARVAVLPGYADADVEARVLQYTNAGGLPAGQVTVNVSATTIAVPPGPTTWPATTVDVSFDHTYFFLGSIGAWFGGSFGTVPLQASATMRNELGS